MKPGQDEAVVLGRRRVACFEALLDVEAQLLAVESCMTHKWVKKLLAWTGYSFLQQHSARLQLAHAYANESWRQTPHAAFGSH